jgi:fructose PTS system EIIBC or EIIC component
MKFVAVTSCPTGIAHTYMAAENLEQSGKAAGHDIQVETQGSAGSVPLDPAVIAAADGVIYAADLPVRDKDRFAGKPFVDVGVKKAVHDAPGVIAALIEAVESGGGASLEHIDSSGNEVPPVGATSSAGPGTKVKSGSSVGSRIRQYLMTGVSYMIPFVAAGGILIALSFLLGGYQITTVTAPEVIDGFSPFSGQDWAGLMFVIGGAAFGFLVPVLSGFIAFAIADRPGITPGFVGGTLAVVTGAGFLGGLATGFIAGFLALWMSRWKVPKAVRGVMPVVVVPLLATLITGLIVLIVIGKPIAWLMDTLSEALLSLTGASAILLGVLLGLMMGFDLGGPINKVAYVFATTGLAAVALDESGANDPRLQIMAAVMAAGMTPPLGLALATVIRKRLFTEPEIENGKAAWILGASFITEGAIPFAAAAPLRVIPATMLGSAVTGGLVMAFGNTLRAPHGGIWVVALISQPLLYLLAVLAGTIVTAVAVIFLKGIGVKSAATSPAGVPVNA